MLTLPLVVNCFLRFLRLTLMPRSSAKGFTLTELTIVLVIVALLIGGMALPLSAQRNLQSVRETQKQLSDISEALLGFAASHRASDGKPYLPCPDTDNDGFENRTGNDCASREGRLPWADLGLGSEDAWGNRFRYAVAEKYSNRGVGFLLSTTGAVLRVCENPACTKVVANNLPLVVVSHGRNGAGAFNASGGSNPPPAGADEIANQDAGNDFVQHTPSELAGNEFDDLVVWVSRYLLFNRMIAVGRLP